MKYCTLSVIVCTYDYWYFFTKTIYICLTFFCINIHTDNLFFLHILHKHTIQLRNDWIDIHYDMTNMDLQENFDIQLETWFVLCTTQHFVYKHVLYIVRTLSDQLIPFRTNFLTNSNFGDIDVVVVSAPLPPSVLPSSSFVLSFSFFINSILHTFTYITCTSPAFYHFFLLYSHNSLTSGGAVLGAFWKR